MTVAADVNTQETFLLKDKVGDGSPTGDLLKGWVEAFDARNQRGQRWYRQASNTILDRAKVPITEELVQAVQTNLPSSFYLHALVDFKPLGVGLTMDDYMEYCKTVTSGVTSRNSYGVWNPDYINTYGGVHNDWRIGLLLKRSGHESRAWNYRDLFYSIIKESDRKGKTDTFDRVFALNRFLTSDFDGTLEDFMALELPPNLQKDYENFIIRDVNADLAGTIRAGVLGFTSGTQKRSRDLLVAQDQKTWRVMIAKAPRWQKGNDHTGICTFIAEAKEEAEGGKLTLPTVDENNKELILLMIESFSKIENLSAERFNALVTNSVGAVPSGQTGEAYRREFRDLIAIIKDADEEVAPREIVGLIFAALHPSLWCRNGSKSGATLLLELLKGDLGSTYRSLITDIVLGKDREIPTEREWRRSEEVVMEGMMAEWAIPLITTGGTRSRKSVPENVAIMRKHVL